jgi:two-component system response regulator AdeR
LITNAALATGSDGQRGSQNVTEPTVLVVDDDPSYVEAYATWLAGDCEVCTATGGRGALDELDENVDVVLLDRRMPDLSGEAVLKETRSRGLDCRIAMVSGVDPELDIVEMPFDDYLVKPVEREQLLASVEALACLDDVADDLRECYTLAVKKAVLETAVEETDLESSEEYASLLDRLAMVEQSVEATIGDLADAGRTAVVYQSL